MLSAMKSTTYGEKITVLNIDEGGIRGTIPGSILSFLESMLQELDGENARLADYSVNSTRGLIPAMLTAPDEQRHPLYMAKDIVPFYLKHCPKIFPQSWYDQYDGKYLRKLLRRILGSRRLHKTVTRVVIPTFDIKLLQPIVFGTFETETNASKDALLSDICICTSAAPSYFPAHNFKTKDSKGNYTEFNLADGGVAANNPALLAMNPTGTVFPGDPDELTTQTLKYDKHLVISLGAGTSKIENKYNAEMAAKWGILGWIHSEGNSPLINAFILASADMVHLHIVGLIFTPI